MPWTARQLPVQFLSPLPALNPSMAARLASALVVDPLVDASMLQNYMVFNEEVRDALATKKPIVALESTGALLLTSFSDLNALESPGSLVLIAFLA